jgi:hypothetical protein
MLGSCDRRPGVARAYERQSLAPLRDFSDESADLLSSTRLVDADGKGGLRPRPVLPELGSRLLHVSRLEAK